MPVLPPSEQPSPDTPTHLTYYDFHVCICTHGYNIWLFCSLFVFVFLLYICRRTGGMSCGNRLSACDSPLNAAISRHPHPSTLLTSPGTPLVSRDCIRSKWPVMQQIHNQSTCGRELYMWITHKKTYVQMYVLMYV